MSQQAQQRWYFRLVADCRGNFNPLVRHLVAAEDEFCAQKVFDELTAEYGMKFGSKLYLAYGKDEAETVLICHAKQVSFPVPVQPSTPNSASVMFF